jgi:choline-sulfatase
VAPLPPPLQSRLRFAARAALVVCSGAGAAASSYCARSDMPVHGRSGRQAPSVDTRPDAGADPLRPNCADPADCRESEPPRAERPSLPKDLSFLLISVDTLRPDLGYAGYARAVSPNLDELASRSTVYERAYSISTYTAYAMPPMMASRYPSEMPRTDRHEVRYMGKNVLLAERLHDAGYRTAGASPHFLFDPMLGWTDGIDKFVVTGSEGKAPPGASVDHKHNSRPLADTAIRFLTDPEITSGPFFVWAHFLDPHKKYLEHPGFSNFGTDRRALYDGEIAFTDHHIGRVLRALAASPAADRTVVIVTGDHGEAFGEHGFFFHGREIWDEVVRIPLLIYVPGAKSRKIARRVSTVDLAPTVLDLAGLPADAEARGQSLASEIFGGELSARPILIDQPCNPNYLAKRGFIESPYKLHHDIEADSYRLFDLDRDPGETIDLADSQPELLKQLQRSYGEFASKIADFVPKRTIPCAKSKP